MKCQYCEWMGQLGDRVTAAHGAPCCERHDLCRDRLARHLRAERLIAANVCRLWYSEGGCQRFRDSLEVLYLLTTGEKPPTSVAASQPSSRPADPRDQPITGVGHPQAKETSHATSQGQ